MQTVLTFTVADSHGLNLSIRTQFVVYSGYFGCVGILFLVFTAFALIGNRLRRSKPPIDD
uniref:Heme exporter protein D n=1 Tax=Heterorhabditis bacteriophora TaxID=37862 RepID=A0A1I7X4L1_HETBA